MKYKNKKITNMKNFSTISKFLKKFNLRSFTNKKKVHEYMSFFQLDKYLKKLPQDNFKIKNLKYLIKVKNENRPLPPELEDLTRLHWLVLARRAINTLEFGSGFSTVFIADAKSILYKYFGDISEIRSDKLFHIYTVDGDKKFLNITKKRLPKNLKKHVSFFYNKVSAFKYSDKIAMRHENVPNISPDLIYLDGPSLYSVKSKFMGFSFNNVSRVPMAADILLIEFFLQSGTFVVVDGRGANAEFLRHYLKRKWKYYYDKKGDCHYFELIEKPWGEWNLKRKNFCLKDNLNFF